jgi:hypothetical protein
MRLWVDTKVKPFAAVGEDAMKVPGKQTHVLVPAGPMQQQLEMEVSLKDDTLACARYLFFIEKRAALNALLELAQARISDELTEASPKCRKALP